MLPTLYSFRRCPYAIRSRMALKYAGQATELREVSLKDKPLAMIRVSSKQTVPILIDLDGTVLDESMDIMFWALLQNDPDKWLALVDQSALLIEKNDFEFKPWLDKYKYSVGYPEHTQSYYRDKSGEFLDILNSRLSANTYLIDQHVRLADIAIFPFIRQFAFVDKAWFDDAPYPKLKNWLDYWLESPLFNSVMQKHPIWQEGNTGIAC
jgi:glutathione S-transferase